MVGMSSLVARIIDDPALAGGVYADRDHCVHVRIDVETILLETNEALRKGTSRRLSLITLRGRRLENRYHCCLSPPFSLDKSGWRSHLRKHFTHPV